MGFAKKILRSILFICILISATTFTLAVPDVLDVTFNEYVYDEVLYNPLKTGGGQFFDPNENQSQQNLYGNILIVNNHPTEAVEKIVLNFSGISNIYNVTNTDGRVSYTTDFNIAGDFVMVLIPDLGPGQNTTLRYDLNRTTVRPPLNMTSSYADSRIFGGLSLGVTDKIQNVMNASLFTDTCLYNINITQTAMTVNSSGLLINTTFDGASMTGADSSNATFANANRTINWNVKAGSCFYAGNTTDISYDVITPTVNVGADYKIVNTTISYRSNNTFSALSLGEISALVDLDLSFDKYINTSLTGDNATWSVEAFVLNPSNITVNLTQVSLWVSVRNGTGTGFTNPSIIDNDTISGAALLNTYNPNVLLNSSLIPWNNSGSEWYFNYTFSSSPIVWMDFDHNLVNDGFQIVNRSVSYGNNQIYIKEIYLATGYWLEITKNITRLSDSSYEVFIQVTNKGNSPTPAGQVVQVYNFIPNTFSLTTGFNFSTSPWYTTDSTNESLNDPIYNGTMFQYGLLPNSNPSNSSLDAFGSGSNQNNTWSVTFSINGSGEFNYDDLFLTGVDPLNVDDYGSTMAVIVEGTYNAASAGLEYLFIGTAIIVGLLALLL
ncbi:MAG: hypothetical protein KC550_01020 [Nanoarchaeota archaeon]|nr:hypothetical protein [Nanoarchaeota archaeon]